MRERSARSCSQDGLGRGGETGSGWDVQPGFCRWSRLAGSPVSSHASLTQPPLPPLPLQPPSSAWQSLLNKRSKEGEAAINQFPSPSSEALTPKVVCAFLAPWQRLLALALP